MHSNASWESATSTECLNRCWMTKEHVRKFEMKTYLDSNEVTLLESAATSLRDKLLVDVLFHLGCRISEALAIAVEDIDFTQGNVTHLKTRLQLSGVWGKS